MINPGSPRLSFEEQKALFYGDKMNDHFHEAKQMVARFFGTFMNDELTLALARAVRDEDESAMKIWDSLSLGDLECLAVIGDYDAYEKEFDDTYSDDRGWED